MNLTMATCAPHFSCIGDELFSITGAFAHICSMALLVLGCATLSWRWIPFWITALSINVLALAYILPKEFWWDEVYETADERGSAWVDAATYISGLITGDLLTLGLPAPTHPLWHGFKALSME